MTHPGWKLFRTEIEALAYAREGGIAILRISDNCHGLLFAQNMVDFRKAARCIGITEKKIIRHVHPKIVLVGKPLVEAMRKCKTTP